MLLLLTTEELGVVLALHGLILHVGVYKEAGF